MKRRSFVKNTLATSVFALGGVSAFQFYQQSLLSYPKSDNSSAERFNYQFLNADDRLVLTVLIPVMVSNLSNLAETAQSNSNIDLINQNIDQAIAQLALRTQKELRDLFDLLDSAFGRVVLAQVWLNWQSAGSKKVDQFFTEWRDSSLELLQIAYKGLHKLIIGSAYAEDFLWPAIGYPGPPQLSLQAAPLVKQAAVIQEASND
ncbi:MAG: hypothetical protein Q9M92_12125 [Enterobacterales bacterium]|nr:hypothetical protein [Enterobacterales bacterium]